MIRLMIMISILQTIVVHGAKQQVKLSESYLPVAMQVIAHLTDQMAFEVDEVTPSSRPTTTTQKPQDETTPFHAPGLYQPAKPPKPADRYKSYQQRFVLLPFEQHAPYTVIKPQGTRNQASLLSVHHEQVKPLVEPSPNDPHFLPPHFDVKASRSDGIDEFSDENLQYLSNNVKEMIKMAQDPSDNGLVDVWGEVRAAQTSATTRAKLSSSNLRLLLLYDLLSRDAKRQRLSEFSGFAPDVMKVLVESSNGGARQQLRIALSKMVERHDCGHEYANNRAREMVEELGRDESKLSSELRYLEPLVYKY
ncbi:uncharacterized protein LOC115448435 [Manduca sexta]|uniref:uncharacterized protein LOC115448435 n=1 Tax=Manduca sexta TaxID=7130 RepID=UPI0018903541|nr:uncharacterized protein LOC115448435 [Manduca sexta]